MRGGVGRYTFNLVRQVRKKGLNVLVASNEEGDGDFSGIAAANNENYRALLKIVDEIQPDIVCIQCEHGLYGLVLDQLNPNKTRTNIDLFYDLCNIPIVTTFHTSFYFKQWMKIELRCKYAYSNMRDRHEECVSQSWDSILYYRQGEFRIDVSRTKNIQFVGKILSFLYS
jgi:hypothetical protein